MTAWLLPFSSSYQVSIKVMMPQFVGISCTLENCADHSVLRGLCLVEVLHTTDIVRIHVAPSQPGTYYLHVYVAPDWRVEDYRHLACSFQVRASLWFLRFIFHLSVCVAIICSSVFLVLEQFNRS